MSELERLLKFENELNFGIETRDGTYYVPKDVAVKAASELLDELAKPQLMIPKSIADKLDKVSFHNPISQLTKESGDLTDFDSDVKDYAWENKNNGYICVAYLAGKALGVDLVKVV